MALDLRVLRFPVAEVDPEPADAFAAGVFFAMQEAVEILSLVRGEERTVEKFVHPIHLLVVGDVKGDLQIVIGVFQDDDAIIVNLRADIRLRKK